MTETLTPELMAKAAAKVRDIRAQGVPLFGDDTHLVGVGPDGPAACEIATGRYLTSTEAADLFPTLFGEGGA